MIFRTITDDITGANKSIGLFGKSLDNIKNIIYSFQTKGVKNTLFHTPLANIDTKAIDKYNKAIQNSIPFEKALDNARKTTNAETVTLIESTNGATISTNALNAAQQASTLAAKAHSAALKAVSIAGNMILFTVITKGIQLAAAAIDNYIHRVEKARERTDELFTEFKQMNDTLADHKKTVAELADRYDELSKHVNTIDNSNISLSDEEYDEFLDINQQLVDIFPELYNGLGENGSAILNIGTSAQSASEYLQELIDKEEYLNNIKIASNLDELFKNVSVQVEDSNSKISQLEEELNSLDATWQNAELMNAGDILGLDMLEIGDNPELINAVSRSIQQLQDEVYAQFKDNKLDTDEYLNFVDNFVNPALYNGATIFDGYVNLIALDDTQKQRLQNIIQEQTESLMNELNDSVSTATGKIALEKQNNDAIWADFIPSFVAAMKSKANFQQLDDVGLGDFAVSLVEQLDYSIIQELKGTAYENDIYGYVRDKILVPIQNAIKDESGEINVDDLEKIKNQISDALDMKDSFNKNDSSVADYVGQVNDLISTLELLGMSPDIIKYVKVVFDYDEAEKLRNRLSNGGQDLVVDDWIDTLTQEEVKLANSTSFDEALERQKQGLDGAALSAENYSAALEEVKSGQSDIGGESGNLTFDQAWAKSFTSENDKVKELGETLLDLAEKGRLTKEVFELADSNVGDYFKNLGISADEAVDRINKLVDEAKQLSSMSSQISSMAEALGTKKENGFVDANTLAGFDVEVRGLESWDRFQEVLGSTTSSYQECQEAANALATEWVNSGDFLAQLTEKNEEYYKTQLKAMGIENYDEVISYAQSLNEAKEVLAQTSLELGNATQDEIEALIQEGTYSEQTANMILALYDAKLAQQATTIDTAADCENLIALAGDANKTSKTVQLLIELMELYNMMESDTYKTSRTIQDYVAQRASEIKAQIDAIANGETDGIEIEPTVKLGSRGKSSAKKAGKDIKDILKEQLSDLEGVISGITSRIDDQISSVNEQKEAALESIDAQKEALEEAKEAAVEALEAERDARLEVIETQKAQLEEQIKLIDKQIKQKQDEIKAIEDAASARERELNLQRSQYELEKMQNMRTKLVKIKCLTL